MAGASAGDRDVALRHRSRDAPDVRERASPYSPLFEGLRPALGLLLGAGIPIVGDVAEGVLCLQPGLREREVGYRPSVWRRSRPSNRYITKKDFGVTLTPSARDVVEVADLTGRWRFRMRMLRPANSAIEYLPRTSAWDGRRVPVACPKVWQTAFGAVCAWHPYEGKVEGSPSGDKSRFAGFGPLDPLITGWSQVRGLAGPL